MATASLSPCAGVCGARATHGATQGPILAALHKVAKETSAQEKLPACGGGAACVVSRCQGLGVLRRNKHRSEGGAVGGADDHILASASSDGRAGVDRLLPALAAAQALRPGLRGLLPCLARAFAGDPAAGSPRHAWRVGAQPVGGPAGRLHAVPAGQQAAGDLRRAEPAGSRRRDCHSAAPSSTFSRRFNSNGERERHQNDRLANFGYPQVLELEAVCFKAGYVDRRKLAAADTSFPAIAVRSAGAPHPPAGPPQRGNA